MTVHLWSQSFEDGNGPHEYVQRARIVLLGRTSHKTRKDAEGAFGVSSLLRMKYEKLPRA